MFRCRADAQCPICSQRADTPGWGIAVAAAVGFAALFGAVILGLSSSLAQPVSVQATLPSINEFQEPTISNLHPRYTVYCSSCISTLIHDEPNALIAEFRDHNWRVTSRGAVLCDCCANTWKAP